MALSTFAFDTGPSILQDVGLLRYNQLTFSPLFETKVNGSVVKDSAGRTTKYIELDIDVDGYVTLSGGALDIAPTVENMYRKLTAHCGVLTYRGRGFDILVDPATSGRDVAWGPVPELLEFQPLGGGLSAKVHWRVKVRIPKIDSRRPRPLLEFTYETSAKYGEDGYSSVTFSGTLEVPMTRSSTSARTLTSTADDYRQEIETRLLSGIDLSRFTVPSRDFNLSRDKRTLTWSVTIQEKPYMDLPPNCTLAHGGYSVKPAKAGMGLMKWLCSLKGTYTVRADRSRIYAWTVFLGLLRARMLASEIFIVGDTSGLFGSNASTHRKAWLIDFSVDEGLYQDSKSVSFSATWRLLTPLQNILVHSGLWKKVPERDGAGNNLWATSVQDVMRSRSWFGLRADPAFDLIVDFGA